MEKMKPTTDELIEVLPFSLGSIMLRARLDVLEEELIHLKYLNENFDVGFLWRNYLTKEIAKIKEAKRGFKMKGGQKA